MHWNGLPEKMRLEAMVRITGRIKSSQYKLRCHQSSVQAGAGAVDLILTVVATYEPIVHATQYLTLVIHVGFACLGIREDFRYLRETDVVLNSGAFNDKTVGDSVAGGLKTGSRPRIQRQGVVNTQPINRQKTNPLQTGYLESKRFKVFFMKKSHVSVATLHESQYHKLR